MGRSKAVIIQNRANDAGFSMEVQPFLTEDQFNWLAERMGLETDEITNMHTATDPGVLEKWKDSPDFMAAYEAALTNKREGYKMLVQQLNGKALRVINDLLGSESVNAKVQGLGLLLRSQALLIDRQERVDPDAIGRLIDKLRSPQVVR